MNDEPTPTERTVIVVPAAAHLEHAVLVQDTDLCAALRETFVG
jgi:hypothetical protein